MEDGTEVISSKKNARPVVPGGIRSAAALLAVSAALLASPMRAGLRFEATTSPNGADVRCLAADSSRIFAGTYRGVWKLEQLTWTQAGLTDRIVGSIAIAGGAVYAATGDAVWLWGGGATWTAETLPGTDTFRTVLVTDGSTVWAAGRTVAKKSGGAWSALPAISGIAVSGTLAGPDLVLGLSSGGALRLTGGAWSAMSAGLGASEPVQALFWDGAVLWAGTSRGVYSWGGAAWVADQALGVHDVRAIRSASGAVWVASADAGVFRKAGAAWASANGSFLTLFARAFASDGVLLYLGTGGGPVYSWNGSTWGETPALDGSTVSEIASKGVETVLGLGVLAATRGAGVAGFLLGQVPSPCGNVLSSSAAPDGSADSFLVATSCGIFTGGEGGWAAMNSGLPSGVVPGALAKTAFGTFAGTLDAGLYRYSSGGWTPDSTPGLPSNASASVLRSQGAGLYLAGSSGLFARTSGTVWTEIHDGLPSAGASVTSLAVPGPVFAGLSAGGVYRRDGSSFHLDAAGISTSPVFSLDAGGTPGSASYGPGVQLLAAAGTGGVMVKRGGGWTREGTGLPVGVDARVVRTAVTGGGSSPLVNWVRAGTSGSGAYLARTDAQVRTVPVVLDVIGATGARFQTELTMAAPGGRVQLTYTPAPGFGRPGDGGTATVALPAGELRAADALGFLRSAGIPIGAADASNPVAGTLAIQPVSAQGAPLPADAAYAVARTYTGTPASGSYGLFYDAPSDVEAAEEKATIYALRSVTGLFRSNLAVVHVPAPGRPGGSIDLSVQVYGASGAAAGAPLQKTLAAGEWYQWSNVLALAGLPDGSYGYAVVTRTAGTDPFVAYGVVNDMATSDGSYLPAYRPGGAAAARRLVVPVVLDVLGAANSHYTTEVTIANDGSIGTPVDLVYQPAPGFGSATGVPVVTVTLAAHEQKTIPDVIAYLRAKGMNIPDPATGGPQAGTLSVHFRYLDALDFPQTVALARTSTPNPDASAGGSFGLFYPAVARGGGARTSARVPALSQTAAVRSNLAVVHTGGGSELPIGLAVQLFDAATGTAAGSVLTVTLQPGDWYQWSKVLELSGALATTTAAYAVVTRVTGDDTFFAYGVLNDNVTSDGSFVAGIPAETY